MAIRQDLMKLANIKAKKNESDEDFMKRLVAKLDTIDDSDWSGLPKDVQEWHNAAVEAVEAEAPIPPIPGDDAGESEEDPAPADDAPAAKSSRGGRKKAGTAAAKPKKEAAAKPKKAAGTGGGRGRTPSFTDDSKITVKTKKNPHKEGSESAKRFDMFKTGMTVGAALEGGVPRRFIRREKKAGNISIAG